MSEIIIGVTVSKGGDRGCSSLLQHTQTGDFDIFRPIHQLEWTLCLTYCRLMQTRQMVVSQRILVRQTDHKGSSTHYALHEHIANPRHDHLDQPDPRSSFNPRSTYHQNTSPYGGTAHPGDREAEETPLIMLSYPVRALRHGRLSFGGPSGRHFDCTPHTVSPIARLVKR